MGTNAFRQRLHFSETIALSIALMAPTTGMALNTPFLAQSAGIHVPLVFAITTLGILAVGYSFSRLGKQFAHAGSVYGLTRNVLGPTVGLVSGWALFLTYMVFVGALLAGFGQFLQLIVQAAFHITVPWLVLALAGGLAVFWLAYHDIRLSTRLMLALEVISMSLTFVVAVFILGHQTATGLAWWRPFSLSGTSFAGISGAMVFGVLTFIGFEGAAILGEESMNAKRSVPHAILWSSVLAGVFFTFIAYAQTMGFGLDAAGVKAFAGSAAPMNQLATQYLGNAFALALDVGAVISTFACALASANGASHILFALARDAYLPKWLNHLDAVTNAPTRTVLLSVALGLGAMVVGEGLWQAPATVYGDLGALATLGVLVAYLATVAASLWYARSDWRAGKPFRLFPELVGLAVIGYVFYANIYPVPPAPLRYFPYLVAVYLAGTVVFSKVHARRAAPVIHSGIAEEA